MEAFEKMKSFVKSLVFSQKRPQVIKTCREIPRINPYNLWEKHIFNIFFRPLRANELLTTVVRAEDCYLYHVLSWLAAWNCFCLYDPGDCSVLLFSWDFGGMQQKILLYANAFDSNNLKSIHKRSRNFAVTQGTVRSFYFTTLISFTFVWGEMQSCNINYEFSSISVDISLFLRIDLKRFRSYLKLNFRWMFKTVRILLL